MNARVSVIIPTHNRVQLLPRAVHSVLTQTFEDYELIVVDDASTDETPQFLETLQGKIITAFHEKCRGPAAARNSGIAKSSAPLIAFLDSDDYWLPQKLEEQISFFDSHPEAVACQTEEIWIRRGKRVNPRNVHRKPSGHMFEPSLRLCLISPSAVMIKRKVLDDIGWFDEELPACEDYDLWLRLTWKWPVHLINKPLVVKHGGHPDQLSARFWGMDRFRIRSIVKLLRSGRLSTDQRQAALRELGRKCRIYASGCFKRGKEEEGRFFESLPSLVEKGSPDPLSSVYLRNFDYSTKQQTNS